MSLSAGEPSYVIPDWSLGDRLRKARRVTGLSQIQFAEQLGENPKSFASWESDNSVPRNLVALAKKVEMISRVPASWVLGLDVSADTEPATRRYRAASSPSRPTLTLVAPLVTANLPVAPANGSSPRPFGCDASPAATHTAEGVHLAHSA